MGTNAVDRSTFAGADRSIEDGAEAGSLDDPARRAETAAALLSHTPAPLFALLDAARDPSVFPWLQESGWEYRCLFQGHSAEIMAEYAPYVGAVPPDRRGLSDLLARSWGQSWGVFLECDQGLDEVRNHLRHFTMVRHPSGKDMYFRFYDPRVLRAFLPTCQGPEARQFFGRITRFHYEDNAGAALISARPGPRGVSVALTNVDRP